MKKIAILASAVIGFASIVTTSAQAAPLAVTVAGVANATTAASPATVAVPETNTIVAGNSVAVAATADANTSVSFAANGVKFVTALATVDAPKTVASGLTSFTKTSDGSAVTVYVYSTSTTTGTLTVTNGAYSTVVYVKGLTGAANNISLTVPSKTAVDTAPSITVSAKDVFGNPVASEQIAVTLVNAKFADGTITKNLTTATKAAADADLTGATVLGSATTKLLPASVGTITVVATDATIADSALGLPAAVKSVTASFVVTDFAAQVTILTGQVTALTSQVTKLTDDLTASVKLLQDTKTQLADLQAKYDALVKLYNAKAKRFKFATVK